MASSTTLVSCGRGLRTKGVDKPVVMANCYLHCGQCLKDRNLHYLRAISRAADGGKQPVFGFGDFNVPAEVLKASGILEGLGLETIVASNDEITCLAGKGSVIDYIVWAKGWKHLVFSCGYRFGALWYAHRCAYYLRT